MISRANPLCVIYLNTYSISNAISTINNLFYAQTYKDIYVALHIDKNAKNANIISVVNNRIALEFDEFIKNNRLFINITNEPMDLLDIYRDTKNIKYNIYIPINTNYIYSKNYISNAINYILKNKDTDFIKISSSEIIDSYGNINNKKISKSDFIFTKDGLTKNKNIKYNEILSNLEKFNYTTLETSDYVQNMIGSQDKIVLNEENFKIVWLEESNNKNELHLDSSYVFVYFQNNKVFNINNNVHGIIRINTDSNFSVDWFGGDAGFQQYQYEFDSKRNVFVNVDI